MESLVRIVLLMLEGRDQISKALKQPYMCMSVLRRESDGKELGGPEAPEKGCGRGEGAFGFLCDLASSSNMCLTGSCGAS